MSRHVVQLEELKDWTFEQTVCASHPKKLMVNVNPSLGSMHFKLYYKTELIGMFGSLEHALEEYNDMKKDSPMSKMSKILRKKAEDGWESHPSNHKNTNLAELQEQAQELNMGYEVIRYSQVDYLMYEDNCGDFILYDDYLYLLEKFKELNSKFPLRTDNHENTNIHKR